MKIETQKTENHEVTFEVTVTAEEFQPYKQQAARKMATQAKIPGFRPGKAPYQVIERMYGNDAIAQEALDLYLEKEYGKMIDEAGIEPGGMGNLNKVDAFDPPAFTVTIPLAPTVDLGDYREIRETYEEPAVSDEDFEKTIEDLRASYATAEPSEDPVADGDQVNALFEIKRKEIDPETGTDVLLKEMPYDFRVGSDDNDHGWPVRNYTKNLLGAKAGDVVKTEHTYGDDAPVDNLKDAEVTFITTVQSVKKMVKPEIDEEFVKNFGEFESVEAFNEDVRKRLKTAKENEYLNGYVEKLTDALVKGATITYAPAALESEVQEMYNNFKQRLQQQGVDLEMYYKIQKTDAEKFLNENIRPDAENQLKRRLAIQEFARLEKIRLDFEKFKGILEDMRNAAGYEYAKAKTKRAKDAILNNVTDRAMNQAFSDSIFDRLIAIGKGENPEIEPAKADAPDGEVKDVAVDSNEVLDAAAEI